MRYLGDEFCYIIKNLADMARSSKQVRILLLFERCSSADNLQPSLAVQPIRTALLRMDPSGSMLTSNHITLVKLALDSGNYVDAVPVLNKFILYFPGASTHPKPSYLCDMSLSPAAFLTPTFLHSTKLKYQEILEYFLWSAMVNIGLRQWDDALQCLESVITYPSLDTPSKIMTEAYKKWVLVGILLEGRLLPLPKSTNQSPARAYHVIAKPYEVLAQIFESGTASRLKSEVEAGSNIFAVDGNVGLVREVLAAFQRFQIRGLAQVYSKISIPEVVSQTTSAVTGCKLTSAQEGENLVRAMIRNGDLHATLSDPPTGPSILTLLSSGPVLTEAQMQTELATTTARIHALTKEIKQTDRMLTHEKEYIKFALKHRKHQKLVSAGDEQALQQQDWIDANDDDEDIMD